MMTLSLVTMPRKLFTDLGRVMELRQGEFQRDPGDR